MNIFWRLVRIATVVIALKSLISKQPSKEIALKGQKNKHKIAEVIAPVVLPKRSPPCFVTGLAFGLGLTAGILGTFYVINRFK